MNITIMGAGRLGIRLAKNLSEENHNITIVDMDEAKIDKIVEKYDVQGACGRATLCDVFNEVDIRDCDLLIATTPSDEHNILSCLIGRRMGAKNTIARVRNPEYSRQINFMREELGISMMINPEFAAAREICRMIQFPSAVNVESFSNGRIDMAGIKIKSGNPICNKKLSELSNKYRNKLLICAVSRNDDVFIPNGDFVIEEGDTLHITGSHKDLYKIFREISNKKSSNIKNIMLIGGSRLSVYLANMLKEVGKNVIVIENEHAKCDQIFAHCSDVSVIMGDYSDYNLLQEEGIDKMDCVVTLTDSDEINFLVSKYSESCGVEKNITMINNKNLPKLIKSVGIDSYVDLAEITCDTITQYVRAKRSISSSYMKTLYKLVDGKIEVIEFVASKDTKFLNKTLSSIHFKKNILIAAVNRNNKIIFPGGNDTILEDDRVVVVSKDCIIYSLNDILA